MISENRYQRQKQQDLARARHANIVDKLAAGPVEKFELALENFTPECKTEGLPSRWVDWDSTPEYREDYEGEAPTERQALAMCDGCPLAPTRDSRGRITDKGTCLAYAEATGQSHGVWGGKRRENGKWLDKMEHTARATHD